MAGRRSRFQMTHERRECGDRGQQICFDDAFEDGQVLRIFRERALRNAGIGNDDIDAAGKRQEVRRSFGQCCVISHVKRINAMALRLGQACAQCFKHIRAARHQGELRALLRILLRECGADAAGRASEKNPFHENLSFIAP